MCNEPIETKEYKNHMIEVYQDENPESPRDWDNNLCTMICFHPRYNLGDEHDFRSPDGFMDWSVSAEAKNVLSALPLYLYDHGMISISTEPFPGRAHHAEWDSGQVGWAYVTREQVREYMGWKRITKGRLEKLRALVASEVSVYDQYLRGEVYWYATKDEDEDVINSCGGFYGVDVAIEDAKKSIDY